MITTSLLIHPDELSKAWVDRMVEHGVDTLAIHPAGGANAHRYLGELIELLETAHYRALLDYAADRGLQIEYEMHAMRYLLPADEAEASPDWFRMDESGRRTTDCNCCASSEAALDCIAEHAAALVKKLYRSTDRYFIWLDDAKDAVCHCPKCASLSPSDQQMKILSHILRRLKRDNAHAALAYLAYYNTVLLPRQITPEPGIFLEFAPYERDFHRPIEGNKQGDALAALLTCFEKEHAKVLDYWYDNSYYSGYKKPPAAFVPDHAVISADLSYYTSLGLRDISSFACYLGADYEALYGAPDIGDLGDFIKNMRDERSHQVHLL